MVSILPSQMMLISPGYSNYTRLLLMCAPNIQYSTFGRKIHVPNKRKRSRFTPHKANCENQGWFCIVYFNVVRYGGFLVQPMSHGLSVKYQNLQENSLVNRCVCVQKDHAKATFSWTKRSSSIDYTVSLRSH